MSDLIKKIEALGKKSDKKALVKLGADELGVDLDASKTAAVLAEELLAVIEERGETDAGDAESPQEPATGEEGAAEEGPSEGDQDSPTPDEPEDPPAPAQKVSDSTTGSQKTGETVGPRVSDSTTRKRYKGKQLKNTKNGRLFPWTAALAKKRNMTEV